MPNFEPRINLSGPLMFSWIVDDPSISLCRRGLDNTAKIFSAGALITILADLIFSLPVSRISDLIFSLIYFLKKAVR